MTSDEHFERLVDDLTDLAMERGLPRVTILDYAVLREDDPGIVMSMLLIDLCKTGVPLPEPLWERVKAEAHGPESFGAFDVEMARLKHLQDSPDSDRSS